MKWESSKMMMPEHVEMLNKLWEEENDIEKPILSEDQLQELNQTIADACEYRTTVDLQYHKNKRMHVATGTIENMRPQQKQILVETEDGLDYLSFDEIVDVSVV